MCGIAGFNWADERLARKMTDALRHRGPDDEGVFMSDRLTLGHRRLSILDLSELGHQPMRYNSRGRNALVTFNGEIFNFREVRHTLESKGYAFRTGSDTETILAAYLEWGCNCVERFNGMWAFAIYDPHKEILFLSRDRFGEKPLYYWLEAGKFIFASEIKAILAHSIPRRANRAVVSEYLYKAQANGSLDSFFAGVRMLPPATNAVFDLRRNSLSLSRYYQPRRDSRRVGPDEFRAALKKAVERRLVSDVPISISLSGGTDSTAVAALTAELDAGPVKAFTTATEARAIGDEREQIAHFLKLYPRFELEESYLSEGSFVSHYRDIVHHMDEPFARQSAYVRWEIAALTGRHKRKVLLNGEGADEVLGGYVPFTAHFLADLARRHMPIRLARELLAVVFHPERDRIVEALRARMASETALQQARRQEAGRLKKQFGVTLEPVWADGPRTSDIKDYLHSLVFEHSLPRLLNCNDKMTMAHSVEGRAPFLDHEFVDLAFSMDARDHVVNGWRKYPLRCAMRGRVPEEILFRKSKSGFNAPIFDYLRSEAIQRRVVEIFANPRTSAVFDPAAYLGQYEAFAARRGSNALFLLHGLLLEEWARTFDVEFG